VSSLPPGSGLDMHSPGFLHLRELVLHYHLQSRLLLRVLVNLLLGRWWCYHLESSSGSHQGSSPRAMCLGQRRNPLHPAPDLDRHPRRRLVQTDVAGNVDSRACAAQQPCCSYSALPRLRLRMSLPLMILRRCSSSLVRHNRLLASFTRVGCGMREEVRKKAWWRGWASGAS
jgi:hypothetical protein